MEYYKGTYADVISLVPRKYGSLYRIVVLTKENKELYDYDVDKNRVYEVLDYNVALDYCNEMVQAIGLFHKAKDKAKNETIL